MPAGYQENKIRNEEVNISLYTDDVKVTLKITPENLYR